MSAGEQDRLRDRFRGCLLGLAVGDALGAPIEGMTSQEIRTAYGLVRDYLPGRAGFESGEGTDDTYQMLAIAESYIETRGLDLDDIARRFTDWFTEDGRGVGRTTAAVLSKLSAGVSHESAAREVARSLGEMAAGNGSLMRCAPTGLLRGRDLVLVDNESRAISRITHVDERSVDSCVVMNRTIAHILHDSHDSLILPMLFGLAEEVIPAVRSTLASLALLKPSNLRTGGFVLETLETALWSLLHSRNFEEGMIALLTLGGDTDTTGAVAGALLGAKFTLRGIPERWVDGLVLRERVLDAADGLFVMASGS